MHSVRVVEYLDSDGEPHFHYKVDGDTRIAHTVGMLEIVKAGYLADALHEDD